MNRNTVISNGTVFGLWPMGRSMVFIGAVLVAILILVEPEASHGLGLLDRTLFWVTNVVLALGALYAASWLLMPRLVHRMPPWLALLLVGVAGAVLMAPLGYLFELVQPDSWAVTEGGGWLDDFERSGAWQGIVAEFLQAGPQVMVIWLAINLPFFTARPTLNHPPGPGGDGHRRQPVVDVDKEEAGRYADDVRNQFLGEIPESLGTNVLAISSDLHYLHVYTDLGRCMILGSLQRAEDAMGDRGIRVHRAHWVARRAIVKIVKDGQQWSCLLTNDLKIPISRRKKSVVAGWFGQSTKIVRVKGSKRGVG
ncbi:LytTR family transcriptional regulator [Marinihelvus fidelis]|uniref:LytTR family transcriptional regulator n=1 Tax=Marinihelvus fidelis TaxID=2613842 RepID=A0A5N0TG90_9GAMM|nr:LytTR family DNA-binding domain-containing protein [Marinihelvus fidelis]KAA9134060.1 LytTR family transcriptional regulator [Marinihelvus fidelis]